MGLLRLLLTFLLGPPLLLVAAGCAAAAAGAQQGRYSLRWDLLTHFVPLWGFGALVCGLLALVLLHGLIRWLVLAASLAGVILSLMLIAPEFTRDAGPRARAPAPEAMKVIQFNVWSHNADPEGTVAWLAAQKPDIAILEETTPAFRRLVEARTGWRSACRDCEVMIYSRMPPLAAGRLTLGRAPGPLGRVTYDDGRGPFTVIGVHNAWPTDGADQQRQEARLAAVIAASPRERLIVTGDFNSTPWSFSRRTWDKAFGIPRRDVALFSWPAGGKITHTKFTSPVPFLPIDHVYAGRGWATVSITRGPKLGSDHYPVVAILAPVAPR
jgi:endonuclease/exonuclease/phosphatase (EEP) superfamily protein YafD